MVDTGSFADWLAGIGSVSAVVAAVGFWILEKRSERRQELMRVSAWVERGNKAEGGGNDRWFVVVMNESQQPILSWRLRLHWESDSVRHEEVTGSDAVGIIPPGRFRFPWNPHEPPKSESHIATTLQFLNAGNCIWQRCSDGRVKRIRNFDDF